MFSYCCLSASCNLLSLRLRNPA
ncbi:hypothetical protein CP8484711_1330A, partial [Chlamydia psittaci 84-8471/1]